MTYKSGKEFHTFLYLICFMYLAENVALRQQNVGRYCRVTHDSSNQPYSVKTALSAVMLFGAPNQVRIDGFWGGLVWCCRVWHDSKYRQQKTRRSGFLI